MSWPSPPRCYNCRHPDTKEHGRPMERDGAARHFEPTRYYFECGGCGRGRTVEA